MKKFYLILSLFSVLLYLDSCKKSPVTIVDFSKITETNNECRESGTIDSNSWNYELVWNLQDTLLVSFADTFSFFDTLTGPVSVSAACPNPSNGLFIWNVYPQQLCKLKVACVNTNYDILYYNTYLLQAEPITLGFDLRNFSAFHKNEYYRMYYAFYTSRDSMYYRGHGDIKIQ